MTAVKNPYERPPVAIGHVDIRVQDVATATSYFEDLGLRLISVQPKFAVMELRGGTHLQVNQTNEPIAAGTPAPIDLMVDDVDATHREYAEKGLDPSPVRRGSIHDTFTLSGPEGYKLSVTSPHWRDRAI